MLKKCLKIVVKVYFKIITLCWVIIGTGRYLDIFRKNYHRKLEITKILWDETIDSYKRYYEWIRTV